MNLDTCFDCGDAVNTDIALECYGSDSKCRCEQCICQLTEMQFCELYDRVRWGKFEDTRMEADNREADA